MRQVGASPAMTGRQANVATRDQQGRGRIVLSLAVALLVATLTDPALAACAAPGERLGVYRTLDSTRLGPGPFGSLQYADTLPLDAGEFVLTFDDGPHPDYTPRILEALEAQCVKATFFVVGRYGHTYPELLQAIASAGHTIANHSWSHPSSLRRISRSNAEWQIRRGDEALREALAPAGLENRIAPLFRFPGLNDTDHLIDWLASWDRTVISGDIGTDDWKRIAPWTVYKRALANMESAGRGIVVMHDTKERTARALPNILGEMQKRGYRVVHLGTGSEQNPLALAQPGAR